MPPDGLRAAACRLRASWRRHHGLELFRAVVCDLQVATGADRGDLIVGGIDRPVVAAASDAQAAALDALVCHRRSPGLAALLSGRVVTVADALDAADARDPWCALAVASDVVAVLAVPLSTDRGPVAAVTLFSGRPAHFSPARVAVATAIAAAAADLVAAELARTDAAWPPVPRASERRAPRILIAFPRDCDGDGDGDRGLRVLRTLARREAGLLLGGNVGQQAAGPPGVPPDDGFGGHAP